MNDLSASEVDRFLDDLKQRKREELVEKQTRAKHRMAQARAEFKQLLPRIVAADKRGERRLEIGVGEVPTPEFRQVLSEHDMRISLGGTTYMSAPPQYDLAIVWD